MLKNTLKTDITHLKQIIKDYEMRGDHSKELLGSLQKLEKHYLDRLFDNFCNKPAAVKRKSKKTPPATDKLHNAGLK